MSFEIFTYGNPDAAAQLVQMVDDHDLSLIEQEVEFIRELSGGQDFGLKAVKVDSWNRDLSPWPAPASGMRILAKGLWRHWHSFSIMWYLPAKHPVPKHSWAATPWQAYLLCGQDTGQTDSTGSQLPRRQSGSRDLWITCAGTRCGRAQSI